MLSLLCVQEACAEEKLRVLIVCDASIGESAVEDARKWEWFFRSQFGRRGLLGSLDILLDDLSPEDVFNYYEDLNSHPDNRLVFCYSGHGEWEPNVRNGHFLRLPKGRLYRRDVLRVITSKPSRAQFVITDCCAVFCDSAHIEGLFEMDAPMPDIHAPNTQVLDDLFFYHDGLVDLQSAECGTLSFYNESGLGNIFTNTFLERFGCGYYSLDTNEDDFITWREFVNHVAVRLQQQPVVETIYREDGEVEIRTHELQPTLFHRGRPIFPVKKFVPYMGEEPIAIPIAGGFFYQ